MIEPTTNPDELDRFCEAMIAIRGEIDAIASGQADRRTTCSKRPHTAEQVTADARATIFASKPLIRQPGRA